MTENEYVNKIKLLLYDNQYWTCAAVTRDIERGLIENGCALKLTKEFMDYVDLQISKNDFSVLTSRDNIFYRISAAELISGIRRDALIELLVK